METVRARNPCAVDISEFFGKKDGFKAGAATSVQQVYDNISFNFDGRLDERTSLLVIDDVWTKGWTVGAVLSHLLDSGLQENAQVTVFAPLVIPQQRKTLLNGCEC